MSSSGQANSSSRDKTTINPLGVGTVLSLLDTRPVSTCDSRCSSAKVLMRDKYDALDTKADGMWISGVSSIAWQSAKRSTMPHAERSEARI